MIKHQYINASDDTAQWCADNLDRQEVTARFFLENMPDAPVWGWKPRASEYGMDPWVIDPDCDVDHDWNMLTPLRIFVQREDLRKRGLFEGLPGGRNNLEK